MKQQNIENKKMVHVAGKMPLRLDSNNRIFYLKQYTTNTTHQHEHGSMSNLRKKVYKTPCGTQAQQIKVKCGNNRRFSDERLAKLYSLQKTKGIDTVQSKQNTKPQIYMKITIYWLHACGIALHTRKPALK